MDPIVQAIIKTWYCFNLSFSIMFGIANLSKMCKINVALS